MGQEEARLESFRNVHGVRRRRGFSEEIYERLKDSLMKTYIYIYIYPMTAYNVSMDHFGPLFCRQALLWVVLPTGSLSGPPTRHEDQRAKKGRPDDLTTCWPIVVPRVLTIQQKVGPGIRALRFSTLVVPRWLLPGAKTDTGTGGSGASPGMIGAFDLGSEEVVIGCSERVEASRGASYLSFSSHVAFSSSHAKNKRWYAQTGLAGTLPSGRNYVLKM